MAYNYLIDLYSYLEEQITELKKKNESAVSNAEREFAEGMIEEFTELEEFLKKNFNRMLPAKIRKKLEDHGPAGIN